MPFRNLSAAVAALLAVTPLALSQDLSRPDAYTRPETVTNPDIPQTQLLAGVRAYPPGVVRALIRVSEDAALMAQLAQDPGKLMNPETISPPVTPELQEAIRQLQQVPEAVPLAAAFPADMARLRDLYRSAPDQLEQQLADLRARYYAARLQGAVAWQQMLSQNPTARDEYQNLVTQFTREQLRQYNDFPYVVVTQPQYYEAAPPNELIVAYSQDRETPASLKSLLDNWWRNHGATALDDQVLSQAGPVAPTSLQPLAALPPQERSALWRPASGSPETAAALMPVIMQPFADQPVEARLAFAVAENARLWGEPLATSQPPVAAAPEGAIPPQAEGAPYAPPPQAEGAPYVAEDEYFPPEAEPLAPGYAETYPDYEYEYEYAPQYAYPQYYSPLVPYYYSYPSVWPVAYSYYPSLYTYWPHSSYYYPYSYYPYGARAFFGFNFGYGPRYFYYNRSPYFHGYYGRYGRFGRFGPRYGFYDRYYGRRYYGRAFRDDGFYRRGFYGGRYDRFGGRDFYGDRFRDGRGVRGFDDRFVGRGTRQFDRSGRFTDRSTFGDRTFRGDRFQRDQFGLAGARTERGVTRQVPRTERSVSRFGGVDRGTTTRTPGITRDRGVGRGDVGDRVRGGALRGGDVRRGAVRGDVQSRPRGTSFRREGAVRGGTTRSGLVGARSSATRGSTLQGSVRRGPGVRRDSAVRSGAFRGSAAPRSTRGSSMRTAPRASGMRGSSMRAAPRASGMRGTSMRAAPRAGGSFRGSSMRAAPRGGSFRGGAIRGGGFGGRAGGGRAAGGGRR